MKFLFLQKEKKHHNIKKIQHQLEEVLILVILKNSKINKEKIPYKGNSEKLCMIKIIL